MERRTPPIVAVLFAAVVVTAMAAPATAGSARVDASTGGPDAVPLVGPVPATVPGVRTAAVSPAGAPTTAPARGVQLQDGETFYVGQVLTTGAYAPGDDVTLRRADGTFVTDVPVAADGTLELATAGRAAGRYTLESPGGPTRSFSLVEQTLGIRAEGGPVQPRTPGTATLHVDTNRPTSVVVLTATRDGEAVEATALQSLVGEGTRVDLDADGTGDALRLTGVGDGDSFALNFSDRPPGQYSLRMTVRDTSASAAAAVSVSSAGNGTATLSAPSKVVSGTVGDTIVVPVDLTNTASARLVLGSDDLAYNVSVRIRDGDGDGAVTVRWNTGLAGTGADESDAFHAAGADSVPTVDRRTGRIGGSIAAEPYPVSLRVDGRETDVGTVLLRASQSPTPTGTAPGTATGPDGRSPPILSGRVCDRNASTLVATYEANADAVPGFAAGMVTDERIHLIVTDDPHRDYTVATGADRRVTAFRRGAPEAPTLVVETDCETVRTVVDAPNTTDAFAEEYRAGEITVRGRTLPTRIAVGLVETLDGIGRALGLL